VAFIGLLIAADDVLMTTDELDANRDANPRAIASELNTGIVYFRGTTGSWALRGIQTEPSELR